MDKKTITIEGMHCGSCVKLIKEEFSKIESIKTVRIDLAKKEAEIEYEGDEPDIDSLNARITPFGFTIPDSKKKTRNNY